MKTKHKRAYKYRFYPTDSQKRVRTDAYCQHGEKLYAHDLPARLTTLQQQPDYVWLAEASRVPPQQALQHLDKAFKNFFAGRAKYPVFKKRPLYGVRSRKHQQLLACAERVLADKD
jgi:putative transposase